MRLIHFTQAVCVAGALLGCSPSRTLRGTWGATSLTPHGVRTTLTVQPDGQWILLYDDVKSPKNRKGAEGTATLNGSRVTFERLIFSSSPGASDPVIRSDFNRVSSVRWVSEDNIEWLGPFGPLSLERTSTDP